MVSKVRVLGKERIMRESHTEKTPPKKQVSGSWILLMFIVLLAVIVILGMVIE